MRDYGHGSGVGGRGVALGYADKGFYYNCISGDDELDFFGKCERDVRMMACNGAAKEMKYLELTAFSLLFTRHKRHANTLSLAPCKNLLGFAS